MLHFVGWWEIGARNPGKLHDFYRSVFGWEFMTENPLNLRLMVPGVGGMRGSVIKVRKDSPEHIRIYIEVADLQGHLRRIEQAGGETVLPPQPIPNSNDGYAYFADTEGHILGIHYMEKGMGSTGTVPVPPIILWEMNARDPAKLSRFYEDVFEWELGPERDGFVSISKLGQRGVSGGIRRSSSSDEAPAVALFVQVEAPEPWVTRIASSGGEVIGPPQALPPSGTWVTFADPEGHVWGLVCGLQPW